MWTRLKRFLFMQSKIWGFPSRREKQALFLGNLRKRGPRVSFLNITPLNNPLHMTQSTVTLTEFTRGQSTPSYYSVSCPKRNVIWGLEPLIAAGRLLPMDLVRWILLSCIRETLQNTTARIIKKIPISWPHLVYYITLTGIHLKKLAVTMYKVVNDQLPSTFSNNIATSHL